MTPADLNSEPSHALDTLIFQWLGLDGFFDAVGDGTQIQALQARLRGISLAAFLLGVQPRLGFGGGRHHGGHIDGKSGGFLATGLVDAI